MKQPTAFRVVRSGSLAAALASLIATSSAPAANIYWDGTGIAWNAATSWSSASGATTPDVLPTTADIATFNISTLTNTAQTVNLDAAESVLGLSFLGTNTATTLLQGGGVANETLTLGASGISIATLAGAVTIGSATALQNVTVILGAAQSWTNNSANALTVVNGVTDGGFLLTLAGTGAINLNGVLSGAGGLTKTGTGVTTLIGANTYTGVTTVSAGILQLGNASALGTTAGATVISGGSLDLNGQAIGAESMSLSGTSSLVNNSASAASLSGPITALASTSSIGGSGNLTLSGIISGTGNAAWKKIGAGTLTLTGTNTFTRAVTVSVGVLNIQNSSALGATTGNGTNSVTSGAALQLQGTITTPTAETFTLNGSGISNDGALRNILNDNTFAGLLTLGSATRINSDSGTLTLSNAGTISGATFGLTVGGAGNTTIASIIGTTSGSLTKDGGGILTLSGASTYTGLTTISSGTLKLGAAGSGANTPLGTIGAGTTVSAGGSLNLNGFTLATAEALTLNGTGVSSGGALTNSSATPATYSGLLTLGSASSIVASSGNIVLSNAGTITGAGFGLTLDGSAAASSLASIIGTGTGTVTKAGSGTWSLSGASTYTGVTTISGGTLKAGVVSVANTSGAFGLNSAISLANTSGAAIDITGFNTQIGSLTGGGATGGNVTLGAATLSVGGDNTSPAAYAGAISGTGALTKIGTGTQIFSGTNGYTGITTVSGGTLQLGAGGTTGSLSPSSAITDNAALVFNRSNALSQGTDFGTISGSGTVSQAGSGTTTLNVTNSYTGLTTVTAGVLNIQSALALGTSTAGTTVSGNAALQIQGGITVAAEALTLNGGGVSNDGALRNISNNNNYGGLVTLASASRINSDSGTLTISNTGTITGAYVLSVGGAGNTAIASIIGTSSLTKDGAGSLTLTATNTYSGTTISAGTLQIGAGGIVGTLGSGAVTDNAALVFNRTDSYGGTVSNAISGSGTVTLSAGTLTLGGSNTYTGATTVSVGTLKLGATGALGNGTSNTSGVSVTSGAVLDLVGISATAAAGITLSGTGITSGGALVNSSATAATYSGLLTLGGATSIVATTGDITLSNTGIVTGSGNSLSVGGVHNTTVASALNTGGGTLTMAGTGTLVLTGQNLFTGTTTINSGGTLQLGSGSTTGSVSTSSGITDNGTLVFNRSNAASYSNVISGTGALTLSGAGTVTLSGTNTYSGVTTITSGTLQIGDGFTDGSIASSSGIVLTSALVYNVVGSGSYANVISGAGSLSKTGLGTLTLSAANTFTGAITVSAGTLQATTSAAALGTGAATLTLAGGSVQLANDTGLAFNRNTTVAANTTITSDRLTSGAGGTQTLGTLSIGAQTLSLAAGTNVASGTAGLTFGATTLTGAATFNPAAGTNLTLGALGGSATGLTKQGAGQLTLAAAGSFTGGVTLNAGVLQLGNASTLNATAGSENAVTFGASSSGTLRLNGNSLVVANLSTNATPGSTFVENANASAATLTVGNSTNLSGSFAGVLRDGTGGGTLGLTKAGTGTLTLTLTGTGTGTGTDTYTGTTTVSAGTLKLGSAAALGSTTGGTIVASGAVLDLLGQTIGAEALTLSGTGISAGGALINSDGTAASLSGAITLAADSSISTVSQLTLSGVIGDSGAVKALTKGGAGVVTLSVANTYTGATNVSVGTLNVTGSLASGSAVAVSGGATLSGTGSVGGSVTVSSGGIITAGNGVTGALAIGGGLTFSSGGTINIGTLSGYTSTAALGLTGNLTLSGGAGAVTLALPGGAVSNGTYHLVSHANVLGSLSGLAVSGPSVGARQSGILTNSSGMLDYVVTGDTPYWTGAGGGGAGGGDGDWTTTAAVTNWKLITAGTATYFLASDSSLFNDSASGTGTVTVNITTNVTPVTATFNNSTRNYVLQQTGGFGITTGSLAKSGTGTLTITNANSYTGGTTLNAGVLQIGNDAALGSIATDSLTLNGGTLSSDSTTARTLANNLILGGDVTLGNATNTGLLTFSGTVDLDGSTHTMTTASDVVLSGIISGSNGGLSKAGAGTLTLSGTNTFTSDVNISAGTLAITSASSLGAVGGMLTFTGNSTLQANASFTVTRGYVINTGVIATVNTNGYDLTNAGVVSGPGALTKTGTGTLTLTGTNTFSGTTTISGGTLQIGNGTTDGSIGSSSGITNNSALEYRVAASSTVDKIISGSGTFTKSGAGTLTMSAANTWSGHTTISAGTLQLGDGSTDGTIVNSSGITNNSSLVFNVAGTSQTYTSFIDGTGILTKTGAGSLRLSGTNTYTGGTTLTAGTLILTSVSSMGGSAGNLTFAGTGTLTSDVDLSGTRSWVINSGATANIDTNGHTFNRGGVVSGDGGLNKLGTGTLAMNNVNTYTGTTTISAGTLSLIADSGLGTAPGAATAGQLVLNGGTLGATADFTLASNRGIALASTSTIDVSSSKTLTYSGVISGSGGLIKNGAGTVELLGRNLFDGNITLNAGTITINSSASLGDYASGSGNLTFAGNATEKLAANVTSTCNYVLNSGMTGTIDTNGYTLEHDGVISGYGSLTKAGGGTLVLDGTNTFTGATTINSGGTLQIGDGVSDGSIATSSGITNNGNLVFNVTADTSYAKVIGGGGTLTKTGAGTLTLTGTSTYTGNTVLAAGTLIIHTAESMGAQTNSLEYAGNATLKSDADRDVTRGWIIDSGATANADTAGHALTMHGVISGDGALNKVGDGTMTVFAENTYTGTTTITAGTLSIAADLGLGAAPTSATAGKLVLNGGTLAATANVTLSGNRGISLASNSSFDVATSTTLSYDGIMAGTGGFTKVGSGTLELLGSNSFEGNITLSAGTITVNSNLSLGPYINGQANGELIFAGNATEKLAADVTTARSFVLNSSVTGTIDTAGHSLSHEGVISGSGALAKTGTGTLTLSGTNTFSGATTISAGTLSISADSGLGTAPESATANQLVLSGATLAATNTFTLNSNRGMALSATNTLDVASTNTLTYGGIISGSGALIKANSGTLTLSGTNTFNCKTTVANGILAFASGNASADGDQALGHNAAVDLGVAGNSSGTLQYTGAAGTLAKNINALGNGSDTIQNSGSGLLTLAGTLTKNGTVLTLEGGSHGITVTGSIVGASANSDLVISGGTTSLAAANTYDGPTYITNGATLNANVAGALPTSPRSDVIMDASGSSGSSNLTLGASQQIASLTGESSSTVALGAHTLTTGSSSGSPSTFAGVISGIGGALVKDGSSTQILTATNTYTGTTTVSGGKLLVGVMVGDTHVGSITSSVSVEAGAALGGSGTITGDVSVASGGTLAPGNSPGVLTTTGTTTFASGSIFDWQLDTAQASPDTNRGVAYDGVNTGSVVGPETGGAIFKIMLGSSNYSDTFWSTSHTWSDIFKNVTGSTVLTSWASIFTSFDGSNGIDSTGNVAGHGYYTLGGNSLTWSAVPEPSSALAGLLLAAGLLHRRRERDSDILN